MSVSSECCVLSGSRLCVGLIARLGESYQRRVSECNREASKMKRPWPTSDTCVIERKICRPIDETLGVANFINILNLNTLSGNFKCRGYTT